MLEIRDLHVTFKSTGKEAVRGIDVGMKAEALFFLKAETLSLCFLGSY